MPLYNSPISQYNNAPSRSLNTAYQISTTNAARVSYTVSISTTLSLLNATSAGQVFLEISADNSTWVTINSAGITRALTVSITVGLNDTTFFNLQGEVPIGWYCRLRSVVSGGSVATFSVGQEVLY